MEPDSDIVGPEGVTERAPVSIASRREGTTGVVVLTGDVDLDGGDAVEDAVAALVADGASRIAIDVQGVTFLDSSGLAGLLAAKVGTEAAGGELRLESVPKNVARVIDLAGVGYLLDPTEEPEQPQ